MKKQYVLFLIVSGCILVANVEAQPYNACQTKSSWNAVLETDIPNSQGQEDHYYPDPYMHHRRPLTNGPEHGSCGPQGCSAPHAQGQYGQQQGGCGPQGCSAPNAQGQNGQQQGGCGPQGCPAPNAQGQNGQQGGCGPQGCPAPNH